MKKLLSTILFVLAVLTMQAKTYKTIKAPEAMACVNVYNGEIKAREVIMRDTATTVHFTIVYPKGNNFRFASDSYLLDEDGNRYALRSCEGLKLDSWVQSPENGVTDFTMHFEPLPKKVQMFDFIEGDGQGAFMLLGIHDKKYKVVAPTLQELSDANPYTVPADWFTTDTITIRGRIEGYSAEKFGFTSMECYYDYVFEKDASTLVFDIAPEVGFDEIRFFARPSETIDITIRPNEQGQYACYYNNGSSKEVERWLKSSLDLWDIAYPLHRFKGKFSEVGEVTERTWQNMLYRLQVESRRSHFTPQEMQLALADLQLNFAYAVMDYAMYHEDDVMKYEVRDGGYELVILDSVEWQGLNKMENYRALHRVDFDNPLLLTSSNYPITLNRIGFARPVMTREGDGLTEGVVENIVEHERKILFNRLNAYRELMGSEGDNIMAQLSIYKNMLSFFSSWRSNEDRVSRILADTTLTADQREKSIAGIQTVDKMMPLYLGVYSHPVIHQKAEQFYAYKMAQTELSTPLPADNPSADLIRSLCAKYPGRYLMIDFWGMGCGPCRAAIQQSKVIRAEIAKRNDIKLIFIAEERTAEGSEAYHNYVKEWLADEEAFCVSKADFTRMEELFRFNGIPHYETITPDGRRVRDDLQITGYLSVTYGLNRLKEKLK